MDVLLLKAVLPKLTLRHRSKAECEHCLPADKVSFTRANASHFLDMNIKGIGIYLPLCRYKYWLLCINTICAAILNMATVH